MKSGVCLCVVMAVLAAGALAQPVVPAEATDSVEQRAEETPRRQLRAVLRPDGEPRARLGALLARYIQQVRKVTWMVTSGWVLTWTSRAGLKRRRWASFLWSSLTQFALPTI
ncbi:cholecystokinin isoform X2 [Grammomys surdaster]|uniref:cholecystokinin isoform X2 n=1 Tax=Grammomys surdaster TaxID=491861 RepID=UPI0010A09ECA|nr:cholecystokinin isoform X2 [Grammomys surdaster]